MAFGESIGNLISPPVVQNGEEFVGDFVVKDIDSGAGLEIEIDEVDVVIEFISYGGSVAVTEQEVIDTTDDHNAEEESDRKDGGDAGIGVVGEKVIPFGKDITQTVSD